MTFQPVVQNVPRLYTALAEWGAVTLFVILLKRRYSNLKTAGLLAVGLFLECVVQYFDGTLPEIFWIPGMLLAIMVMVGIMFSCCKVTIRMAFYHGIRAFMLAELAASLEWQLYHFMIWGHPNDTFLMRFAYVVIIYGLIFAVAFYLERGIANADKGINITNKDLVSAVVIGVVVFAFSNLSFLDAQTPFTSSRDADIFNIRTLADLLGYLILFLYHTQLAEMFLKYERDTMENMLHSQLMQYKLSRESIDLVNRKYHDLKHQIGVLRAETNDEVRNAYLDQMEDEIKIYEAQYKTGNKTLDTILTSQTLYCMKHGIEITCVADGELLSFMEVMDLCTIFGNALDNAVECELKIPDKSKRMISLRVFKQKQFAIISVTNYCEEQVILSEGLPLTSKKDHAYHGFGVKSIQAAAQKYDGGISVSMDKNWFKLLVMIPLR